MARKAAKKAAKPRKAKAAGMFYASKDKHERALALVAAKTHKNVKDAYVALGGSFTQGYGYKEVK